VKKLEVILILDQYVVGIPKPNMVHSALIVGSMRASIGKKKDFPRKHNVLLVREKNR
jgi:hypothetical protein